MSAKIVSTTDKVKKILQMLVSIFPRDVYIIDSMYCVEGEESSASNAGTNFCLLGLEDKTFLSSYFHQSKLIYISDIRKLKGVLEKPEEKEYVECINDEEEIQKYRKTRDALLKKVQNIKTWKRFAFTDKEIIALIEDSEKISLFSDDPEIPEVYIAKSLFPTIIHKDLSQLFYQVIESKTIKDGYELMVNFNKGEFQLYMLFTYLKYKKGEA